MSSLDPSQYFSKSKSDVYTAGPVYYDPRTATYKAIGIKPDEFLVSRCTCDERGKVCAPHELCTCKGVIDPLDTRPCDDQDCVPCNADPSRCAVKPGCECRRNAGNEHMYVCGSMCHGAKRHCKHKHILTPREFDVRVVPQGKIGYGVRARHDIKRGTCLGIYAGELVTGLENMRLTKSLEIATNVNLGFAAYLDPTLWQLPDDAEDATESTTSEATSTSTRASPVRNVENVLAAYKVNGETQLLVCWEGHTAPTWEPDDGRLKHNLTCEDVESNRPDDSAEFSKDIGPDAYAMASGVLNPRVCCELCEEEKKMKVDNREAFDRRAYIHASHRGNYTRFINHSCDPNVDVIMCRYGSDTRAPALPVLFAKTKINKGALLSIEYWHVHDIPEKSRDLLKAHRPEEKKRHGYNDCKCGSKNCTGWIDLPPRSALRHAKVPRHIISSLWNDE